MHKAESILTSIFGLEKFRPRQREIIADVLAGRDTLVVMPTGAGKSLCYQLPAVALRGLTLIISPLISLMTDQVRQLRALRIPAMMLSSNQGWDEQRANMARLREGFRGLTFVAPERFSAPGFLSIITQRKLSLLAIDEAHCISHWGHDFRPEYLRLGEVRRQLGNPLTIALTATATPQVRGDIVRTLALRDAAIHVTGFDRPNLRYQSILFEKARNKDAELIDYLSRCDSGGIVYCSTRKEVEQVAALLEARLRKRTVVSYHAGMEAEERSLSQHRFVEHEDAIVVATNAFGMGINKPNLRFVIHYNIPGSLEAYYQEAGRAGRDGKPADCILYFAMADVRTQRFFIDKIGEGNGALSDDRIATLQKRAGRQLNAMVNYAQWERCRRRQILEYFGENKVPEDCRCDVCGAQRPVLKVKGRAAVLANEHKTRPNPRRAGTQRVQPAAAGRVPFWEKQIAQPASHSGELQTGAPRSRSRICDANVRNSTSPLSRNSRGESGARNGAAVQATQAKVAGSKEVAGGKVGATYGPAVEARFERLRTLRLELAREQGWPPYCVLHDSTLLEIARVRPRTMRELSAVKGMGAKRVERFGKELLAEVAKE